MIASNHFTRLIATFGGFVGNVLRLLTVVRYSCLENSGGKVSKILSVSFFQQISDSWEILEI